MLWYAILSTSVNFSSIMLVCFLLFFLDFCIAVGGWPICVEGERERKGKRLKNTYKMVKVILFTFLGLFPVFYLEFWKVGSCCYCTEDLSSFYLCNTKRRKGRKNYGSIYKFYDWWRELFKWALGAVATNTVLRREMKYVQWWIFSYYIFCTKIELPMYLGL